MNAPLPRAAGRSNRDLWSSWHADCGTESICTSGEEAAFVLKQHGGHGPGCAPYAAAAAFLHRISDTDYE